MGNFLILGTYFKTEHQKGNRYSGVPYIDSLCSVELYKLESVCVKHTRDPS